MLKCLRIYANVCKDMQMYAMACNGKQIRANMCDRDSLLFVCCLLWSFDTPRPVALCWTPRTGGGALLVGYLARWLDGAQEPLSRR